MSISETGGGVKDVDGGGGNPECGGVCIGMGVFHWASRFSNGFIERLLVPDSWDSPPRGAMDVEASVAPRFLACGMWWDVA